MMSAATKIKADCEVHWSERIETVLFSTEENTALDLIVEGGSENGEFAYVGSTVANKINYLSGFLKPGDVILEVQGQKTAGYTQHDVIAWLNHCCKNGNPVVLKVVAGELLVKDLRQYLSFRFSKGSSDHDLQTTIRDNLYLRTVPCTTRLPREGEINGVDYCFLTPEEFMILERSGKLLESGIYEGNHYGTPKPPKENCICVAANWETNGPINGSSVLPGAHPSSDGKRRRNRSNVEAMAANSAAVMPDNSTSAEENVEVELLCSGKGDPSSVEAFSFDNSLGPLPSHWEKAYTASGEPYFIDHTTGTSHWLDPRLARVRKKAVEECNEDELPYGWEKIDDSHYGTYYIDHVNRKTQYENPVLQARLANAESNKCNGYESSVRLNDNSRVSNETTNNDEELTYGSNPELPSQSALSLYLPCLPCINDKQERDCRTSPTQSIPKSNVISEAIDQNHLPGIKPVFTRNPAALEGEFIRTTIVKSSRGFGFTIIGGDDDEEEFLQIKCIVPNGPAWQDGKLKPGDVLVYVNNTCVLGYSHEDIVSLFQSFIPGDLIELEVCRGYAMQFDLSDPNNEVVTMVAVKSDGRTSNNAKLDVTDSSFAKSPVNFAQNCTVIDSLNNGELLDRRLSSNSPNNLDFYSQGSPQAGFFLVHIVKGGNGFGFTIADSVHGQKVKKILDHSRCNELQEGDILVAINNQLVKETPHADVVQLLKDCPNNVEAAITVQRGVGLLSSKTKPKHQKVEPNRDNSKSMLVANSEDHVRESNTSTAEVSGNGVDFWGNGRIQTNSPISKGRIQSTNDAAMHSNDSLYATVIHEGQHVRDTTSIRLPLNDYPAHSVVDDNGNSRTFSPSSNHPMFRHPDDDGTTVASLSKTGHSKLSGSAINYSTNREHLSNVPFDHELERAEPLYPRSYIASSEPYLLHNETDEIIPDTYQLESSKSFWDPHKNSVTKNKSNVLTDSSSLYYHKQETNGPEFYSGYKYGNNNVDFHLSSVNSLGECSSEQESSAYGCHLPLGSGDFYVANQLRTNAYAPDSWRKQSTSFEHEQPSPSSITHILHEQAGDYTKWCLPSQEDVSSFHPTYVELSVTLHRQEAGFGFRIVGGTEEGSQVSQVSIGHIVPDGAADVDGRLRSGDEIVSVDGQNVLNTSHRHVVQLMGNAAANGRVILGIRRLKSREDDMTSSSTIKPFDVTVVRQENEGFGFVIISSINKAGSAIGRIIENSPAQRCPHLHVGDRILAVNGTSILNLHHGEIVNLIKESGYSVTLTVESSQGDLRIPNAMHKDEEVNEDDQYFAVELNRGTRGFGFSIRGGLEFQNMPLFVLRIADNGSAANDGRLKIGDQIIEINGFNTKNMTHARAIEIIKQGGSTVRLLIKRGNKLPIALDHQNPFIK